MEDYLKIISELFNFINIFLQKLTNNRMDLINIFINYLGLNNFKGIVYLIIFFTIYKIISNTFMSRNKYFLIIFELPGTFIHELSHAIVAVITGSKIIKFTILPKFEKDRIILGEVVHLSKNNYFLPLISTAPLYLNTIILILFLNLFITNTENFNIFNNIFSFFLVYFSVVVISSSILSIQDISNFIKSMFNYVFISLIIILIIVIKLFNINLFLLLNNTLNKYIYIISNSILFLLLFSIVLIFLKLIVNILFKNNNN